MKKLVNVCAIGAICSVGSLSAADVIMDQIGAYDGSDTTGNLMASQIFEAGFEVYDVGILDDFTLGQTTDMSSISAIIGGWNGYAGTDGITGYSVNIYMTPEDAGSNLGGFVSLYLANGLNPGVSYDDTWSGGGSHVTLDLEGVTLDAGTYYISVVAHNEYGSNGQTGVMGSNLGNFDAWQANPGGGFGFGAVQSTGANAAYSMTGTAIPAPGALALLGIAGLAMRRRR